MNWSTDKYEPLLLIWKTFATVITTVFENQKENQFAAKTPLQGDLTHPGIKILPTIWSVFSSAFIEAFKPAVDNSLS